MRGGCAQAEAEALLNLALRVREDLCGTEQLGSRGLDLWLLGLQALKRAGKTLDAESLDRLFWAQNRPVSPPAA